MSTPASHQPLSRPDNWPARLPGGVGPFLPTSWFAPRQDGRARKAFSFDSEICAPALFRVVIG